MGQDRDFSITYTPFTDFTHALDPPSLSCDIRATSQQTVAFAEYDRYARRKQPLQTAQTFGALRNARTPLNTPYTPHLIRLSQEIYAHQEEAIIYSHTQTSGMNAPFLHLTQVFVTFRKLTEQILLTLLPHFISDYTVYQENHELLAGMITALVLLPFLLMAIPILIACSIVTSPLWMPMIGCLCLYSFFMRCRNSYVAIAPVSSRNSIGSSPQSLSKFGAHMSGHSVA